jgi:bleomycin hydrolase
MKETLHSNSSQEVLHFISNTLRNFACKLRNLPDDIEEEKLETIKQEMMETIYKILVIFFSEPPETIEWEYYKSQTKGESKKYKKTSKLTPLEFYKQIVPYKIENNICLINYPCDNKPYYTKYNCEDSGNMVDGTKSNYYNLPIDIIKEISRNSLKNKDALWFGCDVGKYSNYELGILDPNLLDYESIFDFTPKLDKCNKLDYFQGEISHAMLLRGTNIIDKGLKTETSNRWLVENSWGEDNTGKTGNFTMSDDWFSENVYMIVVDKKYIKKEILKKFEENEEINLPLWSPFGNLL